MGAAARGLSDILTALDAARSTTETTDVGAADPARGTAGSTTSGPGTAAPGDRTGTQSEDDRCPAAQAKLQRLISQWQQHAARADGSTAWCQRTVSLSREFGEAMLEGERLGCAQFRSGSDRDRMRQWHRDMQRVQCNDQ